MIEINKLPPFKRMCCTIGTLPTSFMESMSYYEALEWLYKYLNDVIIPTVDNNSEAIIELQTAFTTLQNYVSNYFDNLDVQEEINNKLDEMAEEGVLTDIIAQYLGLAGILTFDTVADMKAAENLANGSTCRTMGFYALGDGGGAYYKVREIINTDVINDINLFALQDVTLVAEILPDNNTLNVKKYGAKGNGTDDDASFINAVITLASANQNVYFPKGTYKIGSSITVNKKLYVNGEGTIKLGAAGFNAMNVSADECVIEGLNFDNSDNYTPSTISSGNIGDAIRITANKCIVKGCNISNFIAGVVVGSVGTSTYYGNIVENNHITIKGLNTGYINDGVCSLTRDTIIKNNYIGVSDTTSSRGAIVCDVNAINNVVDGNICECGGYCGVGVHSESSSYTIIKNNNIYNPRLLGTTISTGTIVANNYIETPHTEVSGYTLDHCAVSLYGAPKNCIVDGNLINCFLSTKYAIRGNGNIAGTKITNNSIYSTTSATPTTAMYLHQAEGTIIGYNAIKCTCSTGITVDSKDNVIIGNVITNVTNRGVRLNEAQNCLVANNRIIASSNGIEMYNATNSIAIGNIIGNADTETATGIYAHCTSSSKIMTCADNTFINTATLYDRATYGAKTMVKDNNELDVLDVTLGTRKKITVDNGTITVG